ncbi:hypothetical protein V2I01_39565 [Micromonospora sp. BRA006-A]|nr:hypothetical protein [Micromonospora sp. BRA006-A]
MLAAPSDDDRAGPRTSARGSTRHRTRPLPSPRRTRSACVPARRWRSPAPVPDPPEHRPPLVIN